jgi:heme oxygenase
VRTFMLINHFVAIQTAEAKRLHETETLMADLEQRLESVRAIENDKVQSYEDYVWFDYIKIKAEHAYLVAHLKDLATVAGKPQS